jgi:hypothetical protein
MKVTKSTWMTQNLIDRAIHALESSDRDGTLKEGIAVLKAATPEYLLNILPDDRPDRLDALNYLLSLEI